MHSAKMKSQTMQIAPSPNILQRVEYAEVIGHLELISQILL